MGSEARGQLCCAKICRETPTTPGNQGAGQHRKQATAAHAVAGLAGNLSKSLRGIPEGDFDRFAGTHITLSWSATRALSARATACLLLCTRPAYCQVMRPCHGCPLVDCRCRSSSSRAGRCAATAFATSDELGAHPQPTALLRSPVSASDAGTPQLTSHPCHPVASFDTVATNADLELYHSACCS
jgi:hypothetical protein